MPTPRFSDQLKHGNSLEVTVFTRIQVKFICKTATVFFENSQKNYYSRYLPFLSITISLVPV